MQFDARVDRAVAVEIGEQVTVGAVRIEGVTDAATDVFASFVERLVVVLLGIAVAETIAQEVFTIVGA